MRVLFGGTFDPPTLAHLALARDLRDRLGVEIEWLPNRISPLKSAPEGGVHRIEMLRQLIQAESGFSLNLLELELPEPSYSVQTLRALHESDPGQSWVFCMGADSFENIQRWREWQLLLELCHILVVPRPGAQMIAPREWQDRQAGIEIFDHQSHGHWVAWDGPELDIASSKVRSAKEQGLAWSHWVAPLVADYIEENAIYEHDSGRIG